MIHEHNTKSIFEQRKLQRIRENCTLKLVLYIHFIEMIIAAKKYYSSANDRNEL